jgi:hypothetical protein
MPRKNYQQKPKRREAFQPGGDCTGKRRYPKRLDAEAVIEEQKILHPELTLRAYQCLHCGNWHLTRRTLV